MPSEQPSAESAAVTEVSDSKVIRAMIENGGSFASALGQAASRADHNNLARIKEAFGDYWSHYRSVALQMRSRTAVDTENS